MNMLASLAQEDGVKIAEEKDTLGGGRHIFESGLVKFTVDMAYVGKSTGGAMGLYLTLVDAEGKELKETLWMTSGKEKGCKTYYTKDGTNYPLPGFSQANSLALLVTGKEMKDLATEEKTIKLYNKEAKAEVPTKVQAVVDLLGGVVTVGVIKQVVDKNKETAPNSGVFVPSGETMEENTIDKMFCAREGFENFTTTELKARAESPVFYAEWEKKNKGVTRNKAKGAAGGGGTAGAPTAAGAASTAKPGKSLFGN